MHAAIVELNPLSDPNRAASDDNDGFARSGAHLVHFAMRQIVVRRFCRKLGRRGVYHTKAHARVVGSAARGGVFALDDLGKLVEPEAVDPRTRMNAFDARVAAGVSRARKQFADREQPLVRRASDDFLELRLAPLRVLPARETLAFEIEAADRFHRRVLERTPDA